MGFSRRVIEVTPLDLSSTKRARKIIATHVKGEKSCYTSILYVEEETIKEHTVIMPSINEGVESAKNWIKENFSDCRFDDITGHNFEKYPLH
ncbi:MAG TPA: hypothetical protein PL056_11080 [bacterium]|nr:hypothetical protein [bacterium]